MRARAGSKVGSSEAWPPLGRGVPGWNPQHFAFGRAAREAPKEAALAGAGFAAASDFKAEAISPTVLSRFFTRISKASPEGAATKEKWLSAS